jgi:hypothetical protein
MPFKSEKQRRFLWAKHPDIAKRWTAEYGSTPRPTTAKRAARKAATIDRHNAKRKK